MLICQFFTIDEILGKNLIYCEKTYQHPPVCLLDLTVLLAIDC